MSRLSPLRPFYLLAPLGLLYLVIIGRFVQLHAYDVPLKEQYGGNLEGSSEIQALRGTIYDRNMQPLAYSRPSARLEMGYRWEHRRQNPAARRPGQELTLEEIEAEVRDVAAVAGLNADDLLDMVQNPLTPMKPIAWGIDPFQQQRIQGVLNLYRGFGLVFEDEQTREYPLGRAGSLVVGNYAEYWGEAPTGELDESGEPEMSPVLMRPRMGLERAFDANMLGVNGYKESRRIRHGINPAKTLVEPVPGGQVQLTLDGALQALVRDELAVEMENQHAEAAAVIVLEVKTGAVLAMHSVPDFDPRAPRVDEETGLDAFGEQASLHLKLTDPLEPGSTFKTFIVARALDLGLIRPEETFPDNGVIWFGGNDITNATLVDQGPKTAAECILHSSNVVASQIAQRIGVDGLRFMFDDYGVHRRIQIPGQTWFAGRPITDKRWSGKEGQNYTLPSVSFGQGFYMNPVRLAGNLAAFANDGRPVEPYLIEGQQVELDPICRPETARYVQDAMASMMARQVHHNRSLPDLGVDAAAKSGTSRNPSDHSKNTVLFATFAPLDEPEVLVLAVVYNPDITKVKSRYGPSGTRNAGPLATRVLGHALRIRGVLPPEVPQSLDSDSAPGSLEPGQSHR